MRVQSKKISIVGGPGSGKSTLASQINSALKSTGQNSIFLEEYVVEFIGKYGPPEKLEHQLVVFDRQRESELRHNGEKDFIICDSASWTSYVYGRSIMEHPLKLSDIATLTHLHEKVLNTIDYWDAIFYIPVLDKFVENDGVRYHNQEQSIQIGNRLKTWLEIENVPFIDLSDLKLEERLPFVLNHIKKL